ncbi:MAG: response regulator [Thermodesulfobacteriota bacterium]
MDANRIILGKKVLIVDDEEDILAALIELLKPCKIDTASSFEEAKGLLERHEYDLAVLDIMGVRGFELLEIANRRHVPALMLTAHAMNEESLSKSMEEGAAYFVPKEKMAEIATYAADVLEAKEKDMNPWLRWFKRLGSTFDVAFTGPKWREQRKEFLKKLRDADL